jgi:hypothetical protein
MNTDRFWQIVDAARVAASDIDARVDALQKQLRSLGLEELQSFQNHYDEQIRRSYRWDLWGVAYLINGGCSDDGFRYFRDWLISEGRSVFESAISNPNSLAELPTVSLAELELFGYVACKLFESKGGGELDRDFSTELSMPVGEEWSEDDLPHLFPEVALKYGVS